MPRRLLLLSNSTNYGAGFLEHAGDALSGFLGDRVREILFVPYAAVRLTYEDFTKAVERRFADLGYRTRSIHTADDPVDAVRKAEAVVVGGGNTFHLLFTLYRNGLLDPIRSRVREGAPYIGWSAGANIASPTIRTTNDMPIVEPPAFSALGMIPFQINPHFTDAAIPNHGGETRSERLQEFIAANPDIPVVGLPEGSMLRVEERDLALLGGRPARVFSHGAEPLDVAPGESLQFLMP